jgi:hypothetical protein
MVEEIVRIVLFDDLALSMKITRSATAFEAHPCVTHSM